MSAAVKKKAHRATLKQLLARAEELGARIEVEEDCGDIYAYSPRGTYWVDNGGSTMMEVTENVVGQSWKGEAYANLIDRMNAGLEPVGADGDDDYEGWWGES